MNFTLVRHGNTIESAASSPSKAAPAFTPQQIDDILKPSSAPPESSTPSVVTLQSPDKRPTPVARKPAPPTPHAPETTNSDNSTDATRTSNQQVQPSPASTPSQQAIAAQATRKGNPDAPSTANQDDTASQATDRPTDPYIETLWRYISNEIHSRPVRSIKELRTVRTVRLELHLLESGVLRQVDITESSGKPSLDRAATRSALAASPYPEPPKSARDKGYRFQVELRFTPLNLQ
ncbi:TonB family protein [Marinobacter sp. 1Y8]